MMGAVVLLAISSLQLAHAAAFQSFHDVSPQHPDFAAIEYVKEKGFFKGYPDGNFRPRQILKRSEAVKILVSMRVQESEVITFTKRSYTDVSQDAWYRPYIEAALQKFRLIDGPPQATEFKPEQPVTRAEFLKMLFKVQDVDATGAFDEIRLPLSSDSSDVSAWYYPLLRYALSSSVIDLQTDEKLHPEQQVTRSEAAVMIYRLSLYQADRRTQALLSTEEEELNDTWNSLNRGDITGAEYASARALIAARGAHVSKPGVAIVQAAVKIAEAFRALTRAYRAEDDGNFADVLSLSKEAWALSETARLKSAPLEDLSRRVQTAANRLAEKAREIQSSRP